jgi:F0F1-type ATP synthase assembly protein I
MKINNKNSKDFLNSYARYSSLALQMGVVITGGILGGYFIDDYIKLKFPLFTVFFSLMSVALAIYLAIKDLTKK